MKAFAYVLVLGTAAVLAPVVGASEIAIAWDDFSAETGIVRAIRSSEPWDFVSGPLPVGRQSFLRFAEGKLYALSQLDDRLTVIDPDTWTIDRTYALPQGSEAVDIALAPNQKAYVTRRHATHLLRLDLVDGAYADVLDLSPFADSDGVPDLGTMALDDGRLFVQIQRLNLDDPQVFIPPPYLAVMDLATERLIDVDIELPGIQAIRLAGTAPKLKMQLVPETRQLFVGSSGTFFDAGGIEVVDMDSLTSNGLVIRESDGTTGADLGPFVMIDSKRGFLATSTDLTLSSHLHKFSLEGVEPDELAIAVDYLAPALEYDASSNSIFFPYSLGLERGILVLDANTGDRLNKNLVSVGGPPTDITLVPEPKPRRLLMWGAVLAVLMGRQGVNVRGKRLVGIRNIS